MKGETIRRIWAEELTTFKASHPDELPQLAVVVDVAERRFRDLADRAFEVADFETRARNSVPVILLDALVAWMKAGKKKGPGR